MSPHIREYLSEIYPQYSWLDGDYILIDRQIIPELNYYLRKQNIIEELDWKWYWSDSDIESPMVVIGFKVPVRELLTELKLRFT